MNRLTHERNNGIKTGYWSPEKKEELVKALAAYEDTGLTPDQIKEMDELYHEKCREVAELQKKHRWIPAEEQLPGLDEVVLVQVSGKPAENITLYDAVELAEYNPDEGWILEVYPEWEDAAPVAWMPLPELYQAVKTEL